eukprot:scaffold64598_cov26-Tisochrysis_lutea.AAC.1
MEPGAGPPALATPSMRGRPLAGRAAYVITSSRTFSGVLWGVVGACCGCASGLEIHRNVETMEGGLRGQGGSQTDGHSWDWGWRQ